MRDDHTFDQFRENVKIRLQCEFGYTEDEAEEILRYYEDEEGLDYDYYTGFLRAVQKSAGVAESLWRLHQAREYASIRAPHPHARKAGSHYEDEATLNRFHSLSEGDQCLVMDIVDHLYYNKSITHD